MAETTNPISGPYSAPAATYYSAVPAALTEKIRAERGVKFDDEE